jgi:hypothetical protein
MFLQRFAWQLDSCLVAKRRGLREYAQEGEMED